MSQVGLSPDQVRRIAEAIAREITTGHTAGGPAQAAAHAPAAPGGEPVGHGVFATVDEAVKASRKAFEALDALGLDKRKAIVAAIRAASIANAESLAREAVDETGLGRFEDKVQ
ncbi:MAG: hypothetical protein MUF54_06065, partial [Polyangiaceae bacterium]|nr:hypothetical protein [Polyangiaceae bacterium]